MCQTPYTDSITGKMFFFQRNHQTFSSCNYFLYSTTFSKVIPTLPARILQQKIKFKADKKLGGSMLRTIRLSHPARSLLYNFHFKTTLRMGPASSAISPVLWASLGSSKSRLPGSKYQVKQSWAGHLLPVSFCIIIPFFHIGQKL